MGTIWTWLARAADLVQLSNAWPDSLAGWIRALVFGAISSAVGYGLSYVSKLDPAFLFLIAVVSVAAVLWICGRFPVFRTNAESKREPARRSEVEFLTLLSTGDALFRANGKYKEIEILAYRVYQDRDADGREKLNQYMRETPGKRKYTERDFIAVVDKKLAVKLEANDLIAQGNALIEYLKTPRPGLNLSDFAPSRLSVAFLATDERLEKISGWEKDVLVFIRLNMADREAEFLRDVGATPEGKDEYVHRVETRVDRLARFKEAI